MTSVQLRILADGVSLRLYVCSGRVSLLGRSNTGYCPCYNLTSIQYYALLVGHICWLISLRIPSVLDWVHCWLDFCHYRQIRVVSLSLSIYLDDVSIIVDVSYNTLIISHHCWYKQYLYRCCYSAFIVCVIVGRVLWHIPVTSASMLVGDHGCCALVPLCPGGQWNTRGRPCTSPGRPLWDSEGRPMRWWDLANQGPSIGVFRFAQALDSLQMFHRKYCKSIFEYFWCVYIHDCIAKIGHIWSHSFC